MEYHLWDFFKKLSFFGAKIKKNSLNRYKSFNQYTSLFGAQSQIVILGLKNQKFSWKSAKSFSISYHGSKENVLKGFATFWEFSFYGQKKVSDYEYHSLFAEKIHFHT